MPEPLATATEAAREGVGLVRSVLSVAGTVRRHNDRVADLHEDVTRWARDQLRHEAEARDAARAEARKRLLGTQGLGAQGESAVRRRFAHQWRDRRSQYERDVRDLRHSENSIHRLYRKVMRKPWPENPNTDELARLTRAG